MNRRHLQLSTLSAAIAAQKPCLCAALHHDEVAGIQHQLRLEPSVS
jgi:hypothetical protein